VLERGNIYFFHRPKVDAQAVTGIDDLQRPYMVDRIVGVAPKGEIKRWIERHAA